GMSVRYGFSRQEFGRFVYLSAVDKGCNRSVQPIINHNYMNDSTTMAESSVLDPEQLKEGLAYAERNLLSENSHLYLDKSILRKNFDLRGKHVLDFGCGMGSTALW